MLNIRNVKVEDLPALVAIEHACFTQEEAATEAAFIKRIQLIPDSFWVAEIDGVIAGLVNGPVVDTAFITDDLFSEIKPNPESGGHQTILGLAVSPSHQKQGIASRLLDYLENDAHMNNRETVTLTCKEDLIRYYEQRGYVNHGESSSEHGGALWYNMIKKL